MLIETNPAMAEALRLTRAGRLDEAMATLRSGLAAGAAPRAAPAAPSAAVIDLQPLRVTHGARAQPTRASPPDDGTVGSFEDRSHAGPAGSLDCRLYRPAGPWPGMPLVVMLHGCTQSPEDFARGTGMNALADEFGFLVAYPRQTQAANVQKCWNWFKPGDQQRDRGEPALIAGLTRAIAAEHGVDRGRIYVAGLSAGGAAAAIMAAGYPDLFAAVGIHSGLGCGAARDLPSALAAMRSGSGPGRASAGRFVPVITFHGDRDTTVHEINSREIVAAASAAAGRLATHVETGRGAGRGFSRSISADATGKVLIEQWTVHGLGHAWSGGDKAGSFTDPSGPDASREMVRFFLGHQLATPSHPAGRG